MKEDFNQPPSNAMRNGLPLDYFLLVFVLAVPFWLFGGGRLPLPFPLPAAALVTFVPMTAAAILIHDMGNISWSLFPNFGSHYDPFVTGSIIWLAAGIVLLGLEANKLIRSPSIRASQ